jgi:hypothetical protein
MKELMKILGALFLSMTILFSCGEDAKSDKEKKKDKFKKEIKDPCDILDYSVKIFEDLNDLADNYDDIDDLEDDKKDKKKVDDYFDDLENAWKYAFKEFDNEEMEEVFGGCDNEDEMEESFDEVEYFFEERCQEFLDFISEKMINMQEESYDYEGETEEDYYEAEAAEEYYSDEEVAYDGGWPEDEQRAFMENCVIEGVTTVDYCSCMLEKVLKRYPEPEDALNMDMEWMMKEAQDCL